MSGDRRWLALTALAGAVGLGLVFDLARTGSATYDEVTYLRVAARWWRTGDQEAITRMGSPLGFWKYQQAPTLWLFDRLGYGRFVDDPDAHQAAALPWLRAGCAWIWLAAWGLTAAWARRLHGPRAMAFAAWMFALSPNLLAHGALLTMEMPLIATATAAGLLFSIFLEGGRWRWFVASAVVAGLAFTCKFTAILIPPLCGLCWLVRDAARRDDRAGRGARPDESRSRLSSVARIAGAMSAYLLILLVADWVLTGCALIAPSERMGHHPALGGSRLLATLAEMPMPQDWVGFANQARHQRSGGPSYLLGERRMTGWWSYYFLAMAAKCPPSLWLLVAARLIVGGRRDSLLPLAIAAFLAITAAGSSRNYGVRYVLPVAPLAIVWISALAESGRLAKLVAVIGLAGLGIAVVATHPRELAYFPRFVGGPEGGRRILADSNLDWGQGLRDLARLQRDHPEYRDLTLFYFGLARPEAYGVAGRSIVVDASDRHEGLPARFSASTRYVAVSASLQYGPWGPPGYFDPLRGARAIAALTDFSIALYETPRRTSVGGPTR